MVQLEIVFKNSSEFSESENWESGDMRLTNMRDHRN